MSIPAVVWLASPAMATPVAGRAAEQLSRSAGYALPVLAFALPFHVRATSEPLRREQGRRVLSFPIREGASHLFVRISGRVEFERADILYPDGIVESVDAFGLARDSGVYALADFDRERTVESVRLVMRARSRQARVGVLIGR